MDPIRNPYAPGAGTPPPELAGRDDLRELVRVALERARLGNPARSVLMVGLRGVGKTVLMDRMRDDAEASGIHTLRIETPEERSLPAILAPELRLALLRLSQVEKAKELATRALRALAGFAQTMKLSYGDIEVGLDYAPEPGLADTGDLEHDLQALLEAAGMAAQGSGTVLALFVDELHYVEETQLAALITTLHRAAQRKLPVLLVGAGLPQLRGRMGRAKPYAERLFDFHEIGPLSEDAAKIAITKPAEDHRVELTPDALDLVVARSQGYPYFVQEWGKHSWNAATAPTITAADVDLASTTVIAALDESFFRMRFDRLTRSEKRYLRAMAVLGAGPHRSGDIADVLGRKVTSLGPTRSQLISKGMIWSPSHGDTAFTVPLFDEFMMRIMPGDEWWR
jgi:AAA ATPase domain